MSFSRYNDFISRRMAAGESLSQARQTYRDLKAEGVERPGRWHAARADSIFAKAYTKARKEAGVNENRIRAEVKKSRERLSSRAGREKNVKDAQARRERGKRKGGEPAALPAVPASPREAPAGASPLVLKSVADYKAAMAKMLRRIASLDALYAAGELTYEQWVSSVSYERGKK